MAIPTVSTSIQPRSPHGGFVNEPFVDFKLPENARRMQAALELVSSQLGHEYDLVIGGQRLKTGDKIRSLNPARPAQVVGVHQKAGAEDAEMAMTAALHTFESWSRTSVESRASLLFGAAEIIRSRNFEFCAWLTYEVGKNWAESDRIRDELEIAPNELAERAEIKKDEELPPLEQAEKRVEKLKQEREQLGGVNLRAEEEASEHEQRLAAMISDRDDLIGAVERLRRGIQSLNREGRERLLASFEKVNANFQTLFAKLFGGGEAKLAFTESDDPLEAGLEIYARPPGKRLQSLSLLSGGEQALTAIALIFAVFLVNPAPVCVLDEVDAPLDDANVERFCNLLDEMTRITETRFLVITHHALTMSRMHRLFGVTMAERGISQLVSVTLAEAERAAEE